MITTITDWSHKSWKDGSNLRSTNFNQINILFGHNGAGKSSLALGIAKEYAKSDTNKDSTRLFGGKYVENTLLLEDKSGIRGVISNFGEKDVDLEKKILANNTKVEELTDEVAKRSAERNELIQASESLIKDIVVRRKDKNRKINNKQADKTVHEKVQLWIDDYNKAHKDFPNEDYNQITGAMDLTAESDRINNLVIPRRSVRVDDITENAAIVFKKSYPKVDIPESEIVDWLQTGLHLHNGKSVCEFCGSKFDADATKTKIEAYLNNERHKAAVQLEEYKSALGDVVMVTGQILENKNVYTTTFELNEDDFTSINDASTRLAEFMSKTIDEKLKDMPRVMVIPDSVAADLKAIDDFIATLEEAKKKCSKDITDKINRLETLVKGAIGFEIQNTQTITSNLSAISAHNEQIRSLETQRNALRQKNVELSLQKSDLADFVVYLNAILLDLNLNFKLELSRECYLLTHADGSALKVADISDGERNLLSLIYFYYEMMGDSKGAIKDTVKLVVIDDPISSLDDNNKFYIIELVRIILGQSSVQVFVLTHSWDDFCNVAYGQGDKDTTSLFEISKKAGVSFVDTINSKRLVKPYKLLYKEVYDFSQKATAALTDEETLHIPNIMRRVVEDYIKFAVDVDFATAHKSGDIAKALFGKEIAELSNTQKQKLNVLLSICNILSHKASQPKNQSEVHQSAKFLMSTIENNNKYHHLKMRS